MSTHATLVKVVIGCSLPLLIIASFLLCYISRSLKQLKKEETLADLEIQVNVTSRLYWSSLTETSRLPFPPMTLGLSRTILSR
jgi:hypothetical protein